ncbi:MAG: ABC transporter ATP-binding protein [Clostridia bacterium]|nr:ABC transporter ATP-binding protein [Clostridia bacterium]
MIFGKHINKYYLKYSPMLLLGIVSLVLVDWLQLKVPELYKLTVNGINKGIGTLADGTEVPFDMNFLLDQICRPLLFVIFALIIGRFLWRICFFGSAIRMETDLRSRMFDRCKELSQQFYNKNKVGGMMSLFTNDLETVQECFGDGVLMVADAVVLGGLSLYKMLRMNVVLTLLSLLPMIFLFAIGTVVGKKMTKKWDKRQEAFSNISDYAQESFSGISVIKAFVREKAELKEFSKLNRQNEDANVSFVRTAVLLRIFVTLFVESVLCIIFGYGGYLAHEKIFDVGLMVEFIGYFTSIIWPIMAVSELIDMHSRGKASLKRIGNLLDTETDVKDNADVSEIGTVEGSIEMRNLTFRYPESDIDALSNVSFYIKAGEHVGVIGKTGSGKTTVADLILRTYNVDDGMLFIDGRDVNTIPIKELLSNIAYVPQDNFLFSDTIENNIAFSQDEADHDLVAEAAEASDVHGDITAFPDGYKTVLGERGVTVSGGQKQRISIARALLKNAPILVMDDSVSAVDTGTERKILESLRTGRKGKTTILIAHRVSTVKDMDKIMMIEDGTVIGFGTHEELYETCREYRKTVELQRLEDEEGGDDNA